MENNNSLAWLLLAAVLALVGIWWWTAPESALPTAEVPAVVEPLPTEETPAAPSNNGESTNEIIKRHLEQK